MASRFFFFFPWILSYFPRCCVFRIVLPVVAKYAARGPLKSKLLLNIVFFDERKLIKITFSLCSEFEFNLYYSRAQANKRICDQTSISIQLHNFSSKSSIRFTTPAGGNFRNNKTVFDSWLTINTQNGNRI